MSSLWDFGCSNGRVSVQLIRQADAGPVFGVWSIFCIPLAPLFINISATLDRSPLPHGYIEMRVPPKASRDVKRLTSVNVITKDPQLQLRGRNVAFRVSHMFGGVT